MVQIDGKPLGQYSVATGLARTRLILRGRRCFVDKVNLPSPPVRKPIFRRNVVPLPATAESGETASIDDGSLGRDPLATSTPEESVVTDATEASAALRATMHSERMKAYVSHVVAMAPPLTQEQVSRVEFLLRPDSESPE